MKVTQSDLKLDHYRDTATPGDNPAKRKIDRYLFNRKESYEVALMIQEVMNDIGLEDKQYILILEKMIRDDLPEKPGSRDDVKTWLVNKIKLRVKFLKQLLK